MRARENPFRTERLGRLTFRHPSLSVESLHTRWVALDRRAAIVGPKGSGKTTLLRELGARIAQDGLRVRHWFLNADAGRPSGVVSLRAALALERRDVLLFDGAGHLPWLFQYALVRLCRFAGGLVVTAHEVGPLPTLIETRTDPDLLESLIRELVGTGEGPAPALLEELHARHGGNLRDVFLALYDIAAAGISSP